MNLLFSPSLARWLVRRVFSLAWSAKPIGMLRSSFTSPSKPRSVSASYAAGSMQRTSGLPRYARTLMLAPMLLLASCATAPRVRSLELPELPAIDPVLTDATYLDRMRSFLSGKLPAPLQPRSNSDGAVKPTKPRE